MLSRVAASLFWMARNMERAESNARVLESRLINALESSEYGKLATDDWEAVLEICSSVTEYRSMYDACEARPIAQYITFDARNINSIVNCLENARHNARSVRDNIPEELWELLNEQYLTLRDEEFYAWSIRDIQAFLQQTKRLSFMIQGVIESSMLREEPYHFIKVGKWIERAEKTARVLNVVCEKTTQLKEETQTDHYYYWLSALQFLNGYDAYLKRFPPTMEPKHVLPFLVSYEQFPRSIEYCMDHVREAVMQLEGGKVSHYSEELFQALDHVTDEFVKMKFQQMDSADIGPFLDRFQNDCNRLASVFASTYYFV
ncbi:alpha-E domain-containing protein [Alkalicoccus urumqiensis]|uniref:Alpha-E domain-containing protein n=1 Tax=Alkalicoccus urumqiensis TaxID=1548213 RepID=A0A2P6MK69_ALKUR|nr:alpha-E domain-containing protein [Alkalicoccus urumqiensis]PRO66655.1 alpha-E domain-containing protein [Alkalicoccus urumqiensis]